MNILILLPYGGGSHTYWASTIKKYSAHQVKILEMPGRFWKWRMHGSASYFAKLVNEIDEKFDYILTTSMMNVLEFKGALNERNRSIPIHLYFHENQFAYPVSSKDPDQKSERLEHYQFIQLQSFIAADKVYFNSEYNRQTFLKGANSLLKKLPDFKEHLESKLQRPSKIWKVFIPTNDFTTTKKTTEIIFIWNHRWEEDKNPKDFFKVLKNLKGEGLSFKLIVCGKESTNDNFIQAKKEFHQEIIHFGEAKSRSEYLELLKLATHSIITSNHDFYGISAIELILSGVKTYFPNRLAYPEHFSQSIWKKISYKNINEITFSKILAEYPSFDEVMFNMNAPVHDFIDL